MTHSWFDIGIFGRGARNAISTAGLVLATSAIGVGALSSDSGFSYWQTLLTTFVIWALPGQVIFIAMINSGAGLIATAFAVSFSAVRLMPMVTSILPIIVTNKTPRWSAVLIAHLTAATLWLEARRLIPDQKRETSLCFVMGLGLGLLGIILTAISVGFFLATSLPQALSAGLIFLTPVYFFIALLMSAGIKADYAAIILGTILGPIFTTIIPELDLLLAGILGGTLAFGVYRLDRRRTP